MDAFGWFKKCNNKLSMNILRKLRLFCIVLCFTFSSCTISSEPQKEKNTNEYKTSNAYLNDFTITYEWGINAIGYKISEHSNVRIGVIDTANYYHSNNIYNITVNDLTSTDSMYHGSYIVALLNYIVPNAEIFSINIADEEGKISPESLCKGVQYAYENDCDIINISLGTQYDYKQISREIQNVIANGTIVVASVGNDRRETLDYPANYDGVIGVASRNKDNIDDDSNNKSLKKKYFSAPGSAVFNNEYVMSGSSIATVYMTSIIAAIVDIYPNVTLTEITKILQEASAFSTEYSYGMLNFEKAVLAAEKICK